MNAKALIVNFQILIKQNIGIVALKKIKPGEEIFLPYGSDYWNQMPKIKDD